MKLKSKLWAKVSILFSGAIFLLPFITYAQTPIDCGQIVSASIGVVGEQESYTFTGSPGDAVTIRSRVTSGNFRPFLALYDPSGALAGSAGTGGIFAQLDRTLTSAGTYTLVVRDYTNVNTGWYNLTWQKKNAPCGPTSLSCGQVVSTSISLPVELDMYTFTVSAGDRVIIRASRTSGTTLVLHLELFDSAGALLVEGDNAITRTFTVAGTYTVMVRDSSHVYTGNYLVTWQRFNNSCASALACGQTILAEIGTTVSAPAWRFYTITASAGDVVTIRSRVNSGNFRPSLELYDSGGALLGSAGTGGIFAQLDRTLTSAGTYTLVVRDYTNVNTGWYNLTWQKKNAPCGPTSLSCGQVVSTSISLPVELDMYTFTVSAGDSVIIRATKAATGSFVPHLELFDSAGALLVEGDNAITRTLTVAGTYTVMVRDSQHVYTGNYLVTWQRFNNSCASALACGQTILAEIGTTVSAPAWRFYTITASAGDVVTIRSRVNSGNFRPSLELYDPSGVLLGSAGTGAVFAQLDRTLTTAGTYTLVVRDYSNVSTGWYNLTWQRKNAPCGPTSLSCGQVVSTSISLPVELDMYTFTVSAGDSVILRASRTSGTTLIPHLELYDSAGAFLVEGDNAITRTFTVAGTYTVMVRDSQHVYSGNYLVTWQRFNNSCASALACGQTILAEIGTTVSAPAWRFYTIAASAGDVVTIRARRNSGAVNPYLALYDPSGALIGSAGTGGIFAQLDRMLTTAGTYTLVVRDYSNVSTGWYNLTWQRKNPPCGATAFSCGEVVASSISLPVELDMYTFTVSAGDSVILRASRTSGTTLIPHLELYDSAGAFLVEGDNAITRTFTSAGTYTVMVRDSQHVYSGNYLVTWQRFNNSCASALACGKTILAEIGTTVSAPAWRFYTITASAGDVVTIRSRVNSGNFRPSLELYDSSGVLIGSAGSGSSIFAQLDRTLTTAGTYTLVVRDYSNVSTGWYNLTWQNVKNPCNSASLSCSQVAVGSISGPVEIDAYTFTALSGDVVSVRAPKMSGTFNPYIDLYDPTGALIASALNQIDRTLTVAGTYTAIIRDDGHVYTGYYRLTWQRIKNPCGATEIICGKELPGSLKVAGKIDAFILTAAAGDNIALTLTAVPGGLDPGGLDPSIELYNISGTRLGYQYTTGDQVTLTYTFSSGGTYTVFVSDYGNTKIGRYKLKYQKNSNSCTEITIITPNGGESIMLGTQFTITWTSADVQGLASHEIRLSTDGGLTFPTVIATSLSGTAQSFDWNVPIDTTPTGKARVRVIATDNSAVSTPDDSDGDFTIFQGVVRTYVYDELGRLIQIIFEDGKTVTYTYDAVGNRIIQSVTP